MPTQNQDWFTLSRKLDWKFTYVDEKDVFPEVMSGFSEVSSNLSLPLSSPESLSSNIWKQWRETYKTSYFEYIRSQHEKELSIRAVRDAIGRIDDFESLPAQWISSLKLHFAIMPSATFNCVVGSLRCARFGKVSSWRQTSVLTALDEFRHSQIPLLISQELNKWDPQFEWSQKLYHTENWVSIAFRHALDELILTSNAIDYAIGVHFILKNGFSNQHFMGLSSLAKKVGDKLFEKMIQSIQSDESRHSQIGENIVEIMSQENPEYVQALVDKWFWRTWLLFSFTTGFSMDYLTPIEKRTQSFKEFVNELVTPQFLENLNKWGLKKPWYWDIFIKSLDHYHHMLYSIAYTYRATLWMDLGVPSSAEREWLHRKYPQSWPSLSAVWENIDKKWQENQSNEFDVHATSLPGFCNTCQLPLCGGSPEHNTACHYEYKNELYIFCTDPCRWIFKSEPEKYASHKGLIRKITDGEAPANLLSLLNYFGLTTETSGKDLYKGQYKWML